ncbi:hypothetical protein [Glycomyces albidus]|uniref:Histidine phosphatase family protein n=1 Tax=Glycomyces albidus TaxID=2656774 RepID=A0A6L5G5V1_9ACTN|nr:hypothetical protein [Glycomyces albidus]MQM25017.1 hypothetical protein [Glycomyces albidus]
MGTTERWDLLPKSLQLRKRPEMLGGGIYSLNETVHVKSHGEALAATARILGRLPSANAVEVDWGSVPHEVLGTRDGEESVLVESVTEALAGNARPDERVLLFAHGLCIELAGALLQLQVHELIESIPDFSVYLPGRRLLIDVQFDGLTVIADISTYVDVDSGSTP